MMGLIICYLVLFQHYVDKTFQIVYVYSILIDRKDVHTTNFYTYKIRQNADM